MDLEEQRQIERQIQSLEEEWNGLDSTEIPSTPAAMGWYTRRANGLMKEIAELKKRISSAPN